MGYQTEELVGMMRNPEQTIGNTKSEDFEV
jgi:hypothetical protein